MTEHKTISNLKLIFSGGGTGGHIYPAIAVANKIREQYPDSEILFVGARGKMEMMKVPSAGYRIIGLWISGLQRRLTLSNLMFPFKVIHSVIRSKQILKSFKPHAVVGFGGYASSPIMIAATRKGIKTMLQEQNSYAGVANKAVAKKVDKVCVAYDNMEKYFPAEKIVLTGNPVRDDIVDVSTKRESARDYFKLSDRKETILVLGGSLGARTINESMIQNMQAWVDSDVQILWQTGRLYHEEMKSRMAGYDDENIQLLEFIDRMDLAYAVADVVISRAGALSISELCLAKKPVIFIPSPNVAEDHQTKNARALESKQAALIVEDKNAVNELVSVAVDLMRNSDRRSELSENIGKLATPNATEDIARELLELIKPNAKV